MCHLLSFARKRVCLTFWSIPSSQSDLNSNEDTTIVMVRPVESCTRGLYHGGIDYLEIKHAVNTTPEPDSQGMHQSRNS